MNQDEKQKRIGLQTTLIRKHLMDFGRDLCSTTESSTAIAELAFELGQHTSFISEALEEIERITKAEVTQ